jgi:hypothetical protein
MDHTTRDEIELDLDGTIDAAIKTLQKLKKQYPGGRIHLTSDYEFGESYPKLKLEFVREKDAAEMALDKWRGKLERYASLCAAARAYKAEGDEYPRSHEIAELRNELGAWAESRFGSLVIFDGDVVMWDFEGTYRRDGSWVMRRWTPDLAAMMTEPTEG